MRDAMSVSGWVRDITVCNKGYAGMNLLVHEALTKRKVAMDQLRKGLDCLDVLSIIQKYPDLVSLLCLSRRRRNYTKYYGSESLQKRKQGGGQCRESTSTIVLSTKS